LVRDVLLDRAWASNQVQVFCEGTGLGTCIPSGPLSCGAKTPCTAALSEGPDEELAPVPVVLVVLVVLVPASVPAFASERGGNPPPLMPVAISARPAPVSELRSRVLPVSDRLVVEVITCA